MPQIFPASSNTLFRAALLGTPAVLAAGVGALYAVEWSPWATRAFVPVVQPVQFSHKHHVGQLGIDCRYCHGGVERSAYAGIPPTETCMTCHSQLYTDQPLLAPVRESLVKNRPIAWTRVHDLPDFVYFNHSIHVAKGMSCVACHGKLNEMNVVWQTQTLYMAWCLQCHRHPENFVNDRQEVFNPNWTSLKEQGRLTEARQLVKEYKIQSSGVLTDCTTCHR